MNISNIKIKLDVNIPGSGKSELTRGLFYFPEKEKTTESSYKDELSQYPFFTMDVKYPIDSIKSLGRKGSVDFFFNKRLFKRKMQGLSVATSPGERHKNAIHNVKGMLEVLFPTNVPVKSNLHDSFSEYIKRIPTSVGTSSIIPSFILNLFTKSDEDQFSYLLIGSAKYTTIKVTWVNDIINHPEYRKLLNSASGIWKWLQGLTSGNKGQLKAIEESKIKNEESFKKIWKEVKVLIDNAISKTRTTSRGSTTTKWKEIIDSMYASSGYIKNIVEKIGDYLTDLATVSADDYEKAIEIISEINHYENEAIKIAQRSSILPYELKREYKFDEMYKLIIKIKTSDKVVEFLKHPHRYHELYEEKKEDDKSNAERNNRDLKSELQKYSRFMEFIKQVSSFIKPRRPSNPKLADIIKYYLNERSSSTGENLAEYMYEVHEQYLEDEDATKRPPLSDIDYIEVGVDELKTSQTEKKDELKQKEEPDRQYEIYLQLDVVKGILDINSMSKVKCLFTNAIAKQMYSALKKHKTHDSEIDNSDRIYLDIDVLKQESKRAEETNKQPVVAPAKSDIIPPLKKGGRTRRKKLRNIRKTYRK